MEYSEHEKLELIQDKSQELGFFLEWLQNRFTLCKYRCSHSEGYEWVNEEYYPARIDIELILADYFEIDYEKLQLEKDNMFKQVRVDS